MQHPVSAILKEVTLETRALKKAMDRFADRFAPQFNIFTYLRSDEIGLSRCIADLLDPHGNHGQKEAFLEAFLALEEMKGWENTVFDSVKTEKQIDGGRRIDIYLDFQEGEIIGIENKPWAGDQEDQLSDYAAFIAKEAAGKKWLLIYLSNDEPSDHSGIRKIRENPANNGKFIRISYFRIIEWLEICACRSKADIVRLFIEELAKFMQIHINGKLEMSEENEIRNLILETPQNIESAFQVMKTITSVKETLLNKFHDDLKASLDIYDFELVWDPGMYKNWNTQVGFGVKFSKEQRTYLRFAFDNKGLNNFYWGMGNEDASTEEDEIGSKINSIMTTQFFTGRRTVWYPWWSRADNQFDSTHTNWDSSEAPWIAIKNDELAKKITTLAVKVYNAFKEKEALPFLLGKKI